jgi:hypothetical protein
MTQFTIASAIAGFALIVAGAACIYGPSGLLAAGLMLGLAAHGSMRTPRP